MAGSEIKDEQLGEKPTPTQTTEQKPEPPAEPEELGIASFVDKGSAMLH